MKTQYLTVDGVTFDSNELAIAHEDSLKAITAYDMACHLTNEYSTSGLYRGTDLEEFNLLSTKVIESMGKLKGT